MTKPKLRIDAYYDLQSALIAALEKTNAQNSMFQSCINCLKFREKTEICSLANQRPPARVIAFGCPKWEDVDEIPF